MIHHQPSNSVGNYNYNSFIYQDTAYDSHFHKNFELIYVVDGGLKLQVNGRDQRLSQGELLLIAPYVVHAFETCPDSHVWIGVFSRDFVSRFAQQNGDVVFSAFRCDPFAERFLRDFLFTGEEPEFFLLTSCLYLVCSQCLKNAVPVASRVDAGVVDRVIEYVSQNFTEDITLRETAESLGYEYHYCSKIFHDCFGMNFRDFVSAYRFEVACELLADTQKDYTTIAMESGFQSIRSFNRVFKRLSGHSPREYRTAARKSPRIKRSQ